MPARRPLRGDRRRRRLRRRHRRRGPRARCGASSSATSGGWASARRSATAGGPASSASGRTSPSLSGDDQHEPAELVGALDALLAPQGRLRPGLALDARRPRRGPDRRPRAGVPASTRLVFSVARLPPHHRRDERLPALPQRHPARPGARPRPGLADQLRPGAVRALQGDPARLPGRSSTPAPSATMPARATRRCAACATGGGSSGPPSCCGPASSADADARRIA